MSAETHVAVVMGGWSPEREVSLSSGRGCADALRSEGFQVTEIDAGRNLAEQLAQVKPDVAFNALHGPWGEDGCVQGIFEVMGLPYTHSGVLASALAMDKQQSKAVFAAAGLPLAESLLISREEASRGHVMETPYVVKPHNQGSSVGVFIVRQGENRPPAELSSSKWDLGEMVMVERYIPGRELTCAVIADRVSDVTEITSNAVFYDYEAKYSQGGSVHVVPARLTSAIYKRVQDVTRAAHDSLGCRGVTRSDFRFDEEKGELVLLEINTQPGMTPTSLVPELAAHAGMSYGALVRWMVEDASCGR